MLGGHVNGQRVGGGLPLGMQSIDPSPGQSVGWACQSSEVLRDLGMP